MAVQKSSLQTERIEASEHYANKGLSQVFKIAQPYGDGKQLFRIHWLETISISTIGLESLRQRMQWLGALGHGHRQNARSMAGAYSAVVK